MWWGEVGRGEVCEVVRGEVEKMRRCSWTRRNGARRNGARRNVAKESVKKWHVELWGRKSGGPPEDKKEGCRCEGDNRRFRGQKTVRDCILVGLIGELESCFEKVLTFETGSSAQTGPCTRENKARKMKFFDSLCSYIMQKTKI